MTSLVGGSIRGGCFLVQLLQKNLPKLWLVVRVVVVVVVCFDVVVNFVVCFDVVVGVAGFFETGFNVANVVIFLVVVYIRVISGNSFVSDVVVFADVVAFASIAVATCGGGGSDAVVIFVNVFIFVIVVIFVFVVIFVVIGAIIFSFIVVGGVVCISGVSFCIALILASNVSSFNFGRINLVSGTLILLGSTFHHVCFS